MGSLGKKKVIKTKTDLKNASKGVGKTVITHTKKDLMKKVAGKTSMTHLKTQSVIDAFLNELIVSLEEGNRIELRDFGVFIVKKRSKRIGRNPGTNEEIKIPARNGIVFKIGREFKKRILAGKAAQ